MSSTLVTTYLGEGTHAARPATPSLPTGGIGFYYETDTSSLFVYDVAGAAWVKISGGGVGSPGGSTNSIQYNGGGTFSGLGPLTNGQLVIGSTSAAPVAAALTAGTAISVTNGAGSITVANTGVTSAVAGAGVAVSAATGAVTFSATGAAGTNWVAKTANYNVTSGDSGTSFTNTGAAGSVVFTLPTGVANLSYDFMVDAAQTVEVLCGASDKITYIDTTGAVAGNIQSNTPGNIINISCWKANNWIVRSALGSWTVA